MISGQMEIHVRWSGLDKKNFVTHVSTEDVAWTETCSHMSVFSWFCLNVFPKTFYEWPRGRCWQFRSGGCAKGDWHTMMEEKSYRWGSKEGHAVDVHQTEKLGSRVGLILHLETVMRKKQWWWNKKNVGHRIGAWHIKNVFLRHLNS